MKSQDGATRVRNRIIGQVIKELRIEHGLSQAELGKKIGISEYKIRYLENGVRSLRDDEARMLEQALDLEKNDFDTGSIRYLWRKGAGSRDGVALVRGRIVGQMIRELRTGRGLSQEELGEKIGISRFAIIDIEKGIRSLQDDEARRLEQVFDLEEHYFDTEGIHYMQHMEAERYPINDDLLEWLQSEESVRKALWKYMEGRCSNLGDAAAGLELKDDTQIRYEFIRAVETKQMSVTDACEAFGFSRETYYKYKRAYDERGIEGLIMQFKGPWGHRKKGMDDGPSGDE